MYYGDGDGLISVSKDDMEKVKHPDQPAQSPPKAGGGHIAPTIGSHQVHCLHYIWQDHHMEYFPKTQDKKRRVPEPYERHYERCVEHIRQSLMCQFDTGLSCITGSSITRIRRRMQIRITSAWTGMRCRPG